VHVHHLERRTSSVEANACDIAIPAEPKKSALVPIVKTSSNPPDGTPQQRSSKRLPDLLANQSAECSGSPAGLISLAGEPVSCTLLHKKFDPPIRGGESLLHLAEAERDDLGEVLRRQRVEDDLLVEAVEL